VNEIGTDAVAGVPAFTLIVVVMFVEATPPVVIGPKVTPGSSRNQSVSGSRAVGGLTERQVDRRATGASANGVQGAERSNAGVTSGGRSGCQQRAGNRATRGEVEERRVDFDAACTVENRRLNAVVDRLRSELSTTSAPTPAAPPVWLSASAG